MKRTKILSTFILCILCIGTLVFGVYSAIKVDFTFNGSLNFNPEGVYVDIKGQVYRGTDYNNLTALSGSNYSFNAKNYDDSTGETSGNFPIDLWNPEVAFLPTDKFVQYKVEITNRSNESISAIPSDFTAITNIDNWENSSGILRIDPGKIGVYELNLEYTGINSIQNTNFNITFDIRKTSDFVEAQNELGSNGVTIDVSDGVIQNVTGSNNSSDSSLANTIFIPKTINGADVTSIKTNSMSSSIFNNITAKYIVFEANIQKIENYTFLDCNSLYSVNLPESITAIGQNAFYNCNTLSSINLPSQINDMSMGSIFYNCSSLKSIKIPNGVKSISGWCFWNCQSLICVDLPSTLTTIEDSAFSGCVSLKSISFPNTLTYIGSAAFRDCSELFIKSFPDSLMNIGSGAFNDCTKLIYEEDEILYLKNGDNYYYATIGVTNYSKENYAIKEGCQIIGGESILSDVLDFTISLPNSLLHISDEAFYQAMVNSVTIPDNVKTIGYSAFEESRLEYVTLPKGLIEIRGCAFLNCGFREIILPDTLTYIGESAFYGCNLREITIPKSVVFIGMTAFADCLSLNSATFKDPYNWENSIGEKLDLTDPSLAAEYLYDTQKYGYNNFDWIKTK